MCTKLTPALTETKQNKTFASNVLDHYYGLPYIILLCTEERAKRRARHKSGEYCSYHFTDEDSEPQRCD